MKAKTPELLGVILAAGKGTRMLPFSESYPKPILPIGGKPLLVHQIEAMKGLGIHDIIVVIGYNDHPIITGKGSAIFIHVAQPHYEPTEGCIALSLSDLLEVLALCGTETEIEIC